MGSFFSKIRMTEEQRIAQMSPQARTDYMRCNERRIRSRQYYKTNPDEWYAEYNSY